MAATGALITMDTHCITALRTCPPLLFMSNKFPNSEVSNKLKIFDHTHAIFCPVTLVQIPQPAAGKAGTLKTVFIRFSGLFACFYAANNAMPRLQCVAGIPAARAPIFYTEMSYTQGAVHPAWSNHSDLYRPDFITQFGFHTSASIPRTLHTWLKALKGDRTGQSARIWLFTSLSCFAFQSRNLYKAPALEGFQYLLGLLPAR
jgi:hypothetical protein